MLFSPEGLKEIHFFTENKNYPVAVGIYSDWEKTQLSFLLIHADSFSSEDICKWCISHNIKYDVVYPLSLMTVLRNPYKYYQYLKMQARLKNYSFA